MKVAEERGMHMVRSMSKEEFMRLYCLCAETVKEAFEKYEAAIIRADGKEKMSAFFERVLSENKDAAYADFYYPVLPEEEKQIFCFGLDSRQLAVLGKMETDKGHIYYRLDGEIMKFLLEVTVREWLFSTFYFAHKKVTIWGNYKMEFPIFCEDKAILDHYTELAKECGLECHK